MKYLSEKKTLTPGDFTDRHNGIMLSDLGKKARLKTSHWGDEENVGQAGAKGQAPLGKRALFAPTTKKGAREGKRTEQETKIQYRKGEESKSAIRSGESRFLHHSGELSISEEMQLKDHETHSISESPGKGIATS